MRARAVLLGLAITGLLTLSTRAAAASAQVTVNPDSTGIPSDSKQSIQAARALVAAGHLHQAIERLRLYVAEHPHSIRARRFLGDLYYRANDLSDAEATYLAVLSATGGDRATYNRLGAVYAAENKTKAAIDAYNKSLPATNSIIDLVALHRRRGDLQDFVQRTEDESRIHPRDAAYQIDLGQIFESIDRTNDARVHFQEALNLDPNQADALNGLGLTMLDEGNDLNAERYFKRCLRQRALSYSCTNNLAVTYMDLNRYHAARTLLIAAIARRPEQPEAFVNLGYIHDAHGHWKRAISRYVQALAVGPYWRDAYLNLGLDYKTHHLYSLAESVLLKGIAAVPYDGALHVVLGQTYSAQGKTALALQQYSFATHAFDPNVRSVARALIAALTPTALTAPH